MKFKPATITTFAKFICGDPPYPFPYRTGSNIADFFRGLGFDYNHEGASRNSSAHAALTEINLRSPEEGITPSRELTSIIEELMNKIYFEDLTYDRVDHDDALSLLNKILSPYNLEVSALDSHRLPKLRHIDDSYISSTPVGESIRKITFCPSVFRPPPLDVAGDLVAVMMPFDTNFDPVYNSIKDACRDAKLNAQRADDIWNESSIIQDVFNLIYKATIVLVDFTGKNPNVMYETGIAHTLGKHVVPITQSIDDVPFDLKQHRACKYLANSEGLALLQTTLTNRFVTLIEQNNISASS